eukprot:3151765-Pyramimonas_sp.AAC.1
MVRENGSLSTTADSPEHFDRSEQLSTRSRLLRDVHQPHAPWVPGELGARNQADKAPFCSTQHGLLRVATS